MRGSIVQTEELVPEHFRLRVELLVFHEKEVFARHCLFGALCEICRPTVDWQSHLLADKVRIWSQFDQIRVREPLTELANEALLDDLLVGGLVIRDL